jgi:hypothetical protein
VTLDFPPHVLREYALIADGERGALVGPRGDVCWLCAPRWDSPPVCAALIGGDGAYAVTPVDSYVWGGYYEPGTLIWRSRWVTNDGITECREALAFPGDPDRTVLLRRIQPVDGDAHVRVTLSLARGKDAHREADGSWTGALADGLRWRWTGTGQGRVVGSDDELSVELVVPSGKHHDLVLELGPGEPTGRPPVPDEAWRATEDAWRREVPTVRAVAVRDARHAYAVMRGLTSSGGGMVAAVTASLPERSEAGRNYDYRYVWIRDQCYAGRAAAVAGGFPLLDSSVRFVSERLLDDGPGLRPAYTVDGGRVPDERSLGMPGYPGGSDVVGNQANRQFQLDAFGEALGLFAIAAGHDRLTDDGLRAARTAVEAIASRWQEPDSGIWELEDRPWTHSRLSCAAGLRQLAEHAPTRTEAADWTGLADTIVADTTRWAVHPSGRWQRAPDDPRADGALLLPGLRGAIPRDDPRTLATLAGYVAELTDDGFAYRFRHDDNPLDEDEGAFLLCGFFLALACWQQGDVLAAHRWFERSRTACGPAGLFSEEYDVRQRQLRGNLPQAFVHALLLESAVTLAGREPSRYEPDHAHTARDTG